MSYNNNVTGKHGVYYEKQGTDRDKDDAGKLVSYPCFCYLLFLVLIISLQCYFIMRFQIIGILLYQAVREELASAERRAEEERTAHNATKMVCTVTNSTI